MAAVASKPASKRKVGTFLTDGERLVQVTTITESGVVVEDSAKPWEEFHITTTALRRWRTVEPEAECGDEA